MLTLIGKRLMFAIPSLIGVVIVTFVPSARVSVVVVEPSELVEDVDDAPAIACAVQPHPFRVVRRSSARRRLGRVPASATRDRQTAFPQL